MFASSEIKFTIFSPLIGHAQVCAIYTQISLNLHSAQKHLYAFILCWFNDSKMYIKI